MTHRLCLLLLLVSTALAQVENQPVERAHSLRIRIAMPNSQPCDPTVHIRLMGISGSAAEGFINNECAVEFVDVRTGTYHVSASVNGVEIPNIGTIEVESRNTEEISLSVPTETSLNTENSGAASRVPVPVSELQIPVSASKEFDLASALMAKENWKKAIDRLTKAVSIYPSYARAYNNLAVANARLGNRSAERQALQKAISVNDHFAPAYLNLARMDITDGNYSDAETLLDKATAIDPTDVMTLVLLANMQLCNQRYEQAIATARRVHSMTTAPHASAHTAAAHALEAEGKPREALFELQLFLVEEGTGARAESVRQEISGLLTRMR